MTDRPSVGQVFQMGPESVAAYGTPVAATRRTRSWDVTISPQAETDELSAAGYKVTTYVSLNREWTEFSADVEPDYNELIYLYGSALDSPGTATVAGTAAGGTAYTWTFTPDAVLADVHQSYTVEHGDANHAVQVAGMQLTGMSMDISRENIDIAFDAIGKLQNAVTLGTAAAFVTSVDAPLLPSQINVYLDPTAAALGTTKLTRDMSLSWSVSDIVGPIWPIDSAQTSFAALIPLAQQWELTLTTGADAGTAGMGGTSLYNTLRGGSTVFLRMQGIGGLIAGTHAYTWTQDFALKVVSAPSAEDMDGLFVYAWTMRPVFDSGWANYTTVTLKNAVGVY